MTRRRATILLVAAAVAAAASLWWLVASQSDERQWVADIDSLDRLDPNALLLRPADGANDQRLMTREDLRAKYPFEVELPSRLPAGYSLVTLMLVETGHRSNSSPQDQISARYASPDEEAEFRVNQVAGEDLGSLEGAEETRIRGTRAFYLERTVQGIQFDWLVWTRCERTFAVQSSFGAFTRAELARLAESVGPDSCASR